MEDFLQEKPVHKQAAAPIFYGYRRVFVLVFALALLWQAVSFLQLQLSNYHHALADDFKILLSVNSPLDNKTLAAIGESINARAEVASVKLFSPEDGLMALQQRNPRLANEMVVLGREQMPAYFEIKVVPSALHSVQMLTRQLAAQYPQLMARYVQQQADMAFYTGLCLRSVNVIAILSLAGFLVFMFLIEAYPVRGKSHIPGTVLSALLACAASLAILLILLYPARYLTEQISHFTSLGRQAVLFVFCGLLGWTLGKWQKF